MSTQRTPNATGPAKIFISHDHDDSMVAKQLIDFLLMEFDLSRHEIRCTSATEAAHGLALGKSINEQLREDISKAKLVIGLLSYFGLDSVWVKFELGAAWGKKKKMLPIVGPKLKDQTKLLGPLGNEVQFFVDDLTFETTLMSRFQEVMKGLGIEAKNNPASAVQLALFAETYRQYGGIHADFSNTKVTIISPRAGDTIGGDIAVKFEVENMPENGFLWFGVLPDGEKGMFWPKQINDEGEYTVIFRQGGSLAPGAMAIGVVGVGTAGNGFIKNWEERGKDGKGFPGLCFSHDLRNAERIPGAHPFPVVENLSLQNK